MIGFSTCDDDGVINVVTLLFSWSFMSVCISVQVLVILLIKSVSWSLVFVS
jgi:hypothetical protein